MTIPRIRHSIRAASFIVGTSLLAVAFAGPALAQPGWVLSHQKISDTQGGFTGILGDLDGDGTVGILDLLTLLANWGPCP